MLQILSSWELLQVSNINLGFLNSLNRQCVCCSLITFVISVIIMPICLTAFYTSFCSLLFEGTGNRNREECGTLSVPRSSQFSLPKFSGLDLERS